MVKQILVGSRAFFGNYPDIHSKDVDYLLLVDKGNGFSYVRQVSMPNKCVFEFVRKPKQEMINYALSHGAPMQVGKFLVKEVAEGLGLTIDDLMQLEPLVIKLDAKHEYERIIYDHIISTGSWDISADVLDAAYKAYKASRTNKKDAKGAPRLIEGK